MRQKWLVVSFLSAALLTVSTSSVMAESRECPSGLDLASPPPKIEVCKDKGEADVRLIKAEVGDYEDAYLYCNGQLKKNISFNAASLNQAICWKIEGSQVTVWYKSLSLK